MKCERYITHECMGLKTRRLWPKVWHLGGVLAEREEEGDFIRHNFGKEPVIMVRRQTSAPALRKLQK